jgi:tetratricopeptide (TPR) repeat protein
MSSTALTLAAPVAAQLQRIPVVPWRDPQTVSPGELSGHIARLEQACLERPESADLKTCLGMAYAMNYDVHKSMDVLEAAVEIDPDHFWAQLKYAELNYRLRALLKAERETLKAVDLAANPWELSLARKQLQEIRRLNRESTRNFEWSGSLVRSSLVFAAVATAIVLLAFWR